MHFPVDDLAKRITEFQVAAEDDGKVLGAVGLQIAEKQGRIHSEAFADFSLAENLRPELWERLQAVGTNNGLLRLWTQEKAPFWNRCGLTKPDEETLQKLPAVWRGLPEPWMTLKLREDVQEVISADKEFALFMESERQRTAKTFQQARALKFVATVVAIIVLIFVMVGAFLVLRKNPQFLHR
jgi:hypothetical protein